MDAGSTLNHPFTLGHFVPRVRSLTIVTLAPEEHSYPQAKIRYVYQDLRALEIADDSFDAVVSLSTLEHVGLDNKRFNHDRGSQGDPREGVRQAIRELVRVARPGAMLLISVPFGRAWTGDWVRVFDGDDLDDLVASAEPAEAGEWIYRRGPQGWRVTTRPGAADAEYQEWFAEAVACVRLTLPG
ncbi:MAG TPA: class I SAM-dependent methyltransferase [Solirubrobacteraceae bacterium]|nr:class I SAM-dependent methyltransferase [Solirubrobacteraceae bacterium]